MIQTAFAVGRSVAPLPRRGTDTASAPPSKCSVFPAGARERLGLAQHTTSST
jgi:hypothetical protein